LLAADGRVFSGGNVENASYGLTVCAERCALFAAVAAGCREFKAIAVVGLGLTPAYPCGACRQVLAEFCGPDLLVYVGRWREPAKYVKLTLGALLPRAFRHVAAKPQPEKSRAQRR
jgi:homotetrameric cytidine deaminase